MGAQASRRGADKRHWVGMYGSGTKANVRDGYSSCTDLRVFRLSLRASSVGETHSTITVFELPPRELLSKRVSLESRYLPHHETAARQHGRWVQSHRQRPCDVPCNIDTKHHTLAPTCCTLHTTTKPIIDTESQQQRNHSKTNQKNKICKSDTDTHTCHVRDMFLSPLFVR